MVVVEQDEVKVRIIAFGYRDGATAPWGSRQSTPRPSDPRTPCPRNRHDVLWSRFATETWKNKALELLTEQLQQQIFPKWFSIKHKQRFQYSFSQNKTNISEHSTKTNWDLRAFPLDGVKGQKPWFLRLLLSVKICLLSRMVVFFLWLLVKTIQSPPSKHRMPFSLDVNWTCGPIRYIHWCANAEKKFPWHFYNMPQYEYAWKKHLLRVFKPFRPSLGVSITRFPLPNQNLLPVHTGLCSCTQCSVSLLLCTHKCMCYLSSVSTVCRFCPTLRERNVQM